MSEHSRDLARSRHGLGIGHAVDPDDPSAKGTPDDGCEETGKRTGCHHAGGTVPHEQRHHLNRAARGAHRLSPMAVIDQGHVTTRPEQRWRGSRRNEQAADTVPSGGKLHKLFEVPSEGRDGEHLRAGSSGHDDLYAARAAIRRRMGDPAADGLSDSR